MNECLRRVSKWDVEIKKQETIEMRVRYRFIAVIFLAVAILFQIGVVLAILLVAPQVAHLMMGVMTLSLPTTIGAIGAYLGISAYKKTD